MAGAWSWLRSPTPPAAPVAAAMERKPGQQRLELAVAIRYGATSTLDAQTMTRSDAMSLSVVNRARDLICGVLSTLPFTRYRDRAGRVEDLGPGWLERPDPTRTRGAWTASVVDDLFFHGYALARVTARYADTTPAALQHVPWSETRLDRDAGDWVWTPTPESTIGPTFDPVRIRVTDAVLFESPLTGILAHPQALAIARRLDRAAWRFAASTVPMGWLKQTGGEPLAEDEMTALAQGFATARDQDAIAFLNEWIDYHEANIDPDRLQLVEGRSYQDAAVARVCNVPNFTVGVSVPGDSMTYKTSQSARLDLVDFALAPYVACMEQTLSGPDVTPAGTTVVVDLEPFLRSPLWTSTNTDTVPVPGGTP